MEKIAWLVFGAAVLAAAGYATIGRNATTRTRARRLGEIAFASLFIGAGALVNSYYLVTGYRYADFAEDAPFAFVRDTWRSIVVPHAPIWIGLLIVFELTVGLLVLSGGGRAQIGLVAAIGMHLALPVFGSMTTVWALVMLLAFGLLLRAEFHANSPARAVLGVRASRP
jgi:hypothetical protein